MYERWFPNCTLEEPAEWIADCDEANCLGLFLNCDINAADAAFKLTRPTSDPTDHIGDKQWRLWNLIFDIAAELPETQPQLIALLKAFWAMHDPGDWPIDWKGFGSFGSVWQDAWESFSGRRFKPKPIGRTRSGDKWINFNSFSARLVAESLGNVQVIFGFFVLRDDLEEDLPPNAILVEAGAAAQCQT